MSDQNFNENPSQNPPLAPPPNTPVHQPQPNPGFYGEQTHQVHPQDLGQYAQPSPTGDADFAVAQAIASAPSQGAAMAIAQSEIKSTGVVLLLSLLLSPFWAYIYIGRTARAFAWLAGFVVAGLSVLLLIGIVLLPVVYFWGVYDTYQIADQRNKRLWQMASMHP